MSRRLVLTVLSFVLDGSVLLVVDSEMEWNNISHTKCVRGGATVLAVLHNATDRNGTVSVHSIVCDNGNVVVPTMA